MLREAQIECKFNKYEHSNDMKGLIDFGKITVQQKDRVSNDDSMMFDKRSNHFDSDKKQLISRRTTFVRPDSSKSGMLKSFTEGASSNEVQDEKQKKREEKLKKKLSKFKNIVLKNIEDIMSDIENVYDEITA